MKSFYHTVYCESALYKLHYIDTAPSKNLPTVLCLHGFTRNCKDFISIANEFKNEYRFIILDLLGRGESDYLENKSGYKMNNYLQHIVSLIERLNVEKVHIIGTSLGGLIGIILASLKGTKVASLLLNDVTPKIERKSTKAFMQKLKCLKHCYKTHDEILYFARKMGENFVPKEDKENLEIIANNVIKKNDNGYIFAWDSNISNLGFWNLFFGLKVDLTGLWKKIKCPIFLLWGEHSIFVNSKAVLDAQNLATTNRFEEREIKGIGHAPALIGDEQTKIVREWLKSVV